VGGAFRRRWGGGGEEKKESNQGRTKKKKERWSKKKTKKKIGPAGFCQVGLPNLRKKTEVVVRRREGDETRREIGSQCGKNKRVGGLYEVAHRRKLAKIPHNARRGMRGRKGGGEKFNEEKSGEGRSQP